MVVAALLRGEPLRQGEEPNGRLRVVLRGPTGPFVRSIFQAARPPPGGFSFQSNASDSLERRVEFTRQLGKRQRGRCAGTSASLLDETFCHDFTHRRISFGWAVRDF